jgi:threonine aldolase
MTTSAAAQELFRLLGSSEPGFRIPLHSDTATLPTPEMRRAMAEAPVGDEQRREDPTVNALQEEIARILGKEAALFLPSATMANQIAVRLHCRQGEEAICHEASHIASWEAGAMAALSGVQPALIGGARGIFSGEAVARAARGTNLHNPRTAMVSIENTTNVAGGFVWTPDEIADVVAAAHRLAIPVHCDGSRFMNAAVALASGRVGQSRRAMAAAAAGNGFQRVNDHPTRREIVAAATELARPLDTITICFSKGLGAPVGAALVGSRELIERAMRLKHQFGGAMRQAGVIAAAALYALHVHLPQMADDHRRARRLAEGLNAVEGLSLPPERVESNLLIVDVATDQLDCACLASAWQKRGVGAYPFGSCFRFVVNRDISDAMVEEVIALAPEVVASVRGTGSACSVRVGY